MFVEDWVDVFHQNYMKPAEDDLTPLQKEIFEVSWEGCRDMVGLNTEGDVTKSNLESHNKILN